MELTLSEPDRSKSGAGEKALLFFDAFTQIGPRPNKHPASAWKLSEVLAEMDHCSISGALVASTMSVHYDLMHSNMELAGWLAPYAHLFPIWNAMPWHTGEFPPPRLLQPLLRRSRVRALTIYPKTNAWEWESDHGQEFLAWLERTGLLTIVSRTEFVQYLELDRMLTRHPNLRVLLTGAVWTEQRYVLPLLKKHRNLHISFDKFQIHCGVEELVALGHENQLVFASNAPVMSMGAHRCYVDYAQVSARARMKIASGNLVRLLHGLCPPQLRTNDSEDRLMRAARHAQPLPVPVVDMHMHILHEGMTGAGKSFRMFQGGPKGVFSLAARLGYRGGGIMSWNGAPGCDSLSGNATVTAALDAAPAGYWGLASFDPVHYTQAELARAIPLTYEDRRFIGMKPYVTYGVEYHDPSYDIWWKFGNRHQLYAGIHRNRTDFREVEVLAKKYPRIRWVVYHCGSDYRTADQAVECMRKHSNVYAELTLTSVTHGIVDYLVAHAGEDRVLYGSDLPMRDPRQQLGWVVFSRLSVQVKSKLLYRNAMRVIKPCLPRLPRFNIPNTT